MSDHVQLDLPLLLPDVPDAQDACVQRLTQSLQDRDGVRDAHVVVTDDGESHDLCIHYDPEVISLPRIRQLAKSTGSQITGRYGHVMWSVSGIAHPRRARRITRQLRDIDGVVEAEASASDRIRVEYDRDRTDDAAIRKALTDRGIRVRDGALHVAEEVTDEHDHRDEGGHDHGGIFGDQTELTFALASGACLAVGFGLSFLSTVPVAVSLGFYVAAYGLGGYYTVIEAVENLRDGHFEVDTLMLVAALGAAALGKWAEGAFLLFLFSTGHALEHYAMGRARQAIESLADLAPETARVHRNGTEEEVPVETLQPGDTVLVRPGERIPADGIVTDGESDVNQAPVTGESVPVTKRPLPNPDTAFERGTIDENRIDPDHRLFAGTINGTGALRMRVTRRSSDTTLARVVEMVTEAETEQSPTQRFTDRFERYFVPAVLGLVVLLLFAWIPLDETFADSFYRAMAVLVAASPCALAIATPSAVLSGIARAGRGGVLIKGGGPLENLGTLTAIAFDKTGTLTKGEPHVTEVCAAEEADEDELLATAVVVERLSDHPLAKAIVRYGEDVLSADALRSAGDASAFNSITGKGVRATLGDETVYVGKPGLFDDVDGPALPDAIREQARNLETEGRTTMIVRRGRRYLGIIGLLDTPREEAASVIKELRDLGIRRMVMISGDNQRVADAVGRSLAIDEARGDLLPEDKVDTIRRLRDGEKVAMVGDGVNDAPAMANATVGIAMGAAGSDTALETADVALMADRLDHLPFAVGLSRQTSRIIRQNLWLALGMVAILVPATLLGLDIGPAVVLHEGSTLLVVANALRLLGYSG